MRTKEESYADLMKRWERTDEGMIWDEEEKKMKHIEQFKENLSWYIRY